MGIYFAKYKLVIRFIVLFLFTYALLSIAYKYYLEFSTGFRYFPDYATNLVAQHCDNLINSLGYQSSIVPHESEASLKLIIEGTYIARIVEGCNSISILILFTSFIVAFADNIQSTLMFIIAGSILIYSMNLLRIVLITLAIYHYPAYHEILHTIVFPLIIYGMVFLLWVMWVRRLNMINKRNE